MENLSYSADFSSIAKSATVQPQSILEHPVHLAPQSEIHNGSSIGRCSFLNFRSVVYPNVTIGRFCSIARNCEIGVAAHPTSFLSTHSFQYHAALFPDWEAYKRIERRARFLAHSATQIGNDVWIGAQCIVLAGVRIGDGAVIASNSVVTKDVEPYSIVGGSPARPIRMRFSEPHIEALLELKWWELSVEQLSGIAFDDIPSAIASIRAIRSEASPSSSAIDVEI